jgi:hypothetical protein
VEPGFVGVVAPGLPGFANGFVPPGFANGLVLGLVPGLVAGPANGFVNGLAEVVGAGVVTPTLGSVEPPPPAVALLTQRPNVQLSPMPQKLPHDPQFSRSLERFAHVAKQKVCPC